MGSREEKFEMRPYVEDDGSDSRVWVVFDVDFAEDMLVGAQEIEDRPERGAWGRE